ncbi:MAG TPA: alanine--tRNA ligase, partial [Planctomycetes bacterium]|nr:alanine--tRNA ligase [Planctomycetota bacterium]
MNSDAIRSEYLRFFEERGHTVVQSDSLVPAGDASLLFTGAGMNQFKDMFLGVGRQPYRRAASSQKCLRTGDIENVGRTARHHTFFEMLGNFSFGDYFKKEAVAWAWEFMSGVLGIERERMSVSIFRDDEEAFDLWRNLIGMPEKRIYRFGEHDNFWPADAPTLGPNGPCGPCSEIFVDLGADVGCRKNECSPACDCGRFVEVWNLVFTQFDRRDGGVLAPLPQRNIDTGMGLERIAAVMQGKLNNFETDLLFPLVQQAAAVSGRRYGAEHENDRRMKRIADHARAVTFAMADGALPSNEGRGYVVRRLIRRAELDGAALGVNEPFLHHMVETVGKLMGGVYPEVVERAANIGAFIRSEEERFRRTLENGVDRLDAMTRRLPKGGVFPGQEAFVLYDTYGFPVELTREILAEKEVVLDEDGFRSAMETRREETRSKAAFGAIFPSGPLEAVKAKFKPTEFTGYFTDGCEEILGALVAGCGVVGELAEGEEGVAVFARSPFYAEAGGQVADTGTLSQPSGEADVVDVQKSGGVFLHRVKVRKGVLKTGEKTRLDVDTARRLAIKRNHTATHLLHRALREIIGEHVEQAGSHVSPERLRLDFTHFEALPQEVIEKVEERVNRWIISDRPVNAVDMPLEEARRSGALALFGEKYGEVVRMVDVEGTSRELCGGTHLERTGRVGPFLIQREESVSAGVRRIEALTGDNAWKAINAARKELSGVVRELKAPSGETIARVEALKTRLKELERELREARTRGGAGIPPAPERI